jgi:hypothetical protein
VVTVGSGRTAVQVSATSTVTCSADASGAVTCSQS